MATSREGLEKDSVNQKKTKGSVTLTTKFKEKKKRGKVWKKKQKKTPGCGGRGDGGERDIESQSEKREESCTNPEDLMRGKMKKNKSADQPR